MSAEIDLKVGSSPEKAAKSKKITFIQPRRPLYEVEQITNNFQIFAQRGRSDLEEKAFSDFCAKDAVVQILRRKLFQIFAQSTR